MIPNPCYSNLIMYVNILNREKCIVRYFSFNWAYLKRFVHFQKKQKIYWFQFDLQKTVPVPLFTKKYQILQIILEKPKSKNFHNKHFSLF